MELFIENLARFEDQIASLGLSSHEPEGSPSESYALADIDLEQTRERGCYMAYDQIKNAHREVYALMRLPNVGSSLDIRETLEVLVDKVGPRCFL